MRVIGRAGRHPDQQISPVLRAVDMQQTPLDAGVDLEPVRRPRTLGHGARQVGALALDPVEESSNMPAGGGSACSAGRSENMPSQYSTQPRSASSGFQPLGKGAPVLLAEQPEDILRRLVGPGLHWLRHSCNFSTAR